jgi:questin oxidase-like protein
MPLSCYVALDEALELLAGYDIQLKNGNSNHAPMVAEALCAMRRPQAVMPWIAGYRERLVPRRPAGDPIHADNWRSALGERGRFADWAEFFAEELRQAPWPEVLDRWTGRLAPGFCAAATHGIIRVGHAVRSLTVAETPLRTRELGDALAGWAATYRELPGSNGATDCPMKPSEASQEFRSLRRLTAAVSETLPPRWPCLMILPSLRRWSDGSPSVATSNGRWLS